MWVYAALSGGGKCPGPRLVWVYAALSVCVRCFQNSKLCSAASWKGAGSVMSRHAAGYVAAPMGVLARWRDGLQSLHVWAVVPCAQAMASSSNLPICIELKVVEALVTELGLDLHAPPQPSLDPRTPAEIALLVPLVLKHMIT